MSFLEAVGAPAHGTPAAASWRAPCGVDVWHTCEKVASAEAAQARLERALDQRRGMLAFHGADRAVGYADPPIEITLRGDAVVVQALNERGCVLLPAFRAALREMAGGRVSAGARSVRGLVPRADQDFAEEQRTRHAGVFTAIRAFLFAMAAPYDQPLGLYGAFGYDLIFQLEPVELHQVRDPRERALVLHLPDEILEFDLRRGKAVCHRFEFSAANTRTHGLPRATPAEFHRPATPQVERDHKPGEYTGVVARAMALFHSGDLFEVVPGQAFHRPAREQPSVLFQRLRERNPAPHSLLMNLGEREYLVGASPEMFVAVRRGRRDDRSPLPTPLTVRSAPISGTIARGRDALEDEERIGQLLGSVKDKAELTMCTDVDRNDKAKVCVPGTVRVTARRQIEMYSSLIHTVDRVEGQLRPGRDALDAFLAHMWAVTVTGAPKLAAVQFLEREERSPRGWYGGAVGCIRFDGSLDTVLTLRTIHLRDGVGTVRVGATLLYQSSPQEEEAETELKAMALLQVLGDSPRAPAVPTARTGLEGSGLQVLLVDHQDSFVHCLADYLRQTGATVVTHRWPRHLAVLERERPDLLVLSPGPGRPADFGLDKTIAVAQRLGIPVFGVCLGFQGLVEFYGGELGVLATPVHGMQSRIEVTEPGSRLMSGLPATFEVGRYHSIFARTVSVPQLLQVTAVTDGGIAMAVEHRKLPVAAVQFHPESIMTARDSIGHRIIGNAVRSLAGPKRGVRTMSGPPEQLP